MRVLVIGGGGREHALVWALRQSSAVREVHAAPGNDGIGQDATIHPVPAEDLEGLEALVRREGFDLVVVGPEAPLVAGLADRLRERGTRVFGPSAAAARLEGSKAYAKEFMARHGIPTAEFEVFEEPGAARKHLQQVAYPIVVKADGLAAGKGVVIAGDRAAAEDAVQAMMEEHRFGEAGRRVVIEACLQGREASFFALCDGDRFVPLATCQDYKRAGDGDQGPNTGGMGSYSPSVFLTDALLQRIAEAIVAPTLAGMAAEGTPYRGVLYVGLMLTSEGPKVLEYNVRFGDPETQALVPRLDGDWVPWLRGAAEGRLPEGRPAWKANASVCVVLASAGYPGAYEKGKLIEGLDGASALQDVAVFHAGTRRDEQGRWRTAGGRVLGVTAWDRSLAGARHRAYAAVEQIRWDGMHYRRDIARDAMEAMKEEP